MSISEMRRIGRRENLESSLAAMTDVGYKSAFVWILGVLSGR